jgi:hypothetical protein
MRSSNPEEIAEAIEEQKFILPELKRIAYSVDTEPTSCAKNSLKCDSASDLTARL